MTAEELLDRIDDLIHAADNTSWASRAVQVRDLLHQQDRHGRGRPRDHCPHCAMNGDR